MPLSDVPLFGTTRTRIARRHALIAPDGHMDDAVPGWTGARTTVLISPRLAAGAAPGFVQLAVQLGEGGGAAWTDGDIERFVFVLHGTVRVRADDRRSTLAHHGFAWLPAGGTKGLSADEEARLLVFERRHEPVVGAPPAPTVIGDAATVPSTPFLGLDGVRVRSLMPDDASYDLSMSLMTYRPGAALPMVETHEAEHGLLLLAGSGILRLDEAWYPVRQGDAVWMGPYCPQWFAALGEREAVYLMYKDGRRGPWAGVAG